MDILFEKVKVKKINFKAGDLPSMPTNDFILPALTAGIQNQGLNNYVPYSDVTILKNKITISANGANTGVTFFQNKEFTVLQDAYAIDWKYTSDKLKDYHYLFLVGCIMNKIYGNFEWTNKAGWEKVKKESIQLPTKNGAIDFDFMESFIAELEQERMQTLQAYLQATGLDNYELTPEEQKALEEYEKLEFADFPISKVFDIKNTGNILSRDIVPNSGRTPYLGAGSENNSVSSYIKYDEKYIDKGNCVFIGGKTFVVTYQETDFFSNDSHNLTLTLKNEEYKNKLTQLFLVTCVNKSLRYKYSWGDSVSNKKILKDLLSLPTTNKEENYKVMEPFIRAIQKLVLKNVVQYTQKKLTTI